MIEIKNLTIQFNRQPPVVEEMSLTVPEGGRTIILGESGSGKSVTLAAILGILPSDAAVRGSIKIGGAEMLGLRERELRKIRGKVIGYIPQGSGNGMNPLMTVGEQVSEPLVEHSGLKKGEALQKAKAWMERLGLTPADKLAKAYPHTLSGGMRQRALMAMGAAGGAKILLADEPTKGLDEKRIAEVEKLLLALEDRTLLCVSHDIRFASRVADTVCVMLLEALPENGLNCPGGYAPSINKRFACTFAHRCPQASGKCLETPEMTRVEQHNVRCHLYGA